MVVYAASQSARNVSRMVSQSPYQLMPSGSLNGVKTYRSGWSDSSTMLVTTVRTISR